MLQSAADVMHPTSDPALCGSCRSPAPHVHPLLPTSGALELLDVLPHAVPLPLRLHVAPAPEGESIASLGVAHVAKHRRDHPEAMTVFITTDVTVDLALHLG